VASEVSQETGDDANPPLPPQRPSVAGLRVFAVREAGHVVADSELSSAVGDAVLYAARLADSVGYHLGAGELQAIEIFGRGCAYARVTTPSDGSLQLEGCGVGYGGTTEELRAWLETGARL
jgi:hypothetical protein